MTVHAQALKTSRTDEYLRVEEALRPHGGRPALAVIRHALLSELGLESWLKNSGGKGLHVVVPLTPRLDYDEVKSFSQVVVQHLARTLPSRFVAKSGPENRIGKVFVDYLRTAPIACQWCYDFELVEGRVWAKSITPTRQSPVVGR